MKKISIFLCMLFIIFFSCISFSFWDSSPDGIVNDMKTPVQDTAISNNLSQGEGLNDSLEKVKTNSTGYIQWLGYIGLSVAVILIVYNGIVLLANFGEENKLSKVKKRFVSLILGVILLTSAYIIIKLIVAFVGGIFS